MSSSAFLTLPVPENRSSAHFSVDDVVFVAFALGESVDNVACGAFALVEFRIRMFDEAFKVGDIEGEGFTTREDVW
jgi:hypothetical protein